MNWGKQIKIDKILILIVAIVFAGCGKKRRPVSEILIQSQDLGEGNKVSISLLPGAGLGLTENASNVRFRLDCSNPEKMNNYVDEAIIYGDGTGCSIDITSFDLGGKTYSDPDNDGTFISAIGQLSLAEVTLPSPLTADASVRATFNEVKKAEQQETNGFYLSSTVSVSLGGLLAPNYAVTSANIGAVDPTTPGLTVGLSCNVALVDNKCSGLALSDLRIAIADNSGQDITYTTLGGMTYNSVPSYAGDAASFSAGFSLAQLGL